MVEQEVQLRAQAVLVVHLSQTLRLSQVELLVVQVQSAEVWELTRNLPQTQAELEVELQQETWRVMVVLEVE